MVSPVHMPKAVDMASNKRLSLHMAGSRMEHTVRLDFRTIIR